MGQLAPLKTKMKALGRVARDRGMRMALGASLVSETQGHFRQQADPWGRRWASLSRWTLASKAANKTKIGIDSGRMRNSIFYRLQGRNELKYGSGLPYFRYFHQGTSSAIIRPKRAKSLKLMTPGGQVIFRKQVHRFGQVPRRVLGIGPGERRRIREITGKQFREGFRKG